MGMGMVCHTLNPRLFLEQLQYIITHGDDVAIFFDSSFVDIIEKIVAMGIAKVKNFIVLTDKAHMPKCNLPGLRCYEDLLEGDVPESFNFEDVKEEEAAGLCYTSGTTGLTS